MFKLSAKRARLTLVASVVIAVGSVLSAAPPANADLLNPTAWDDGILRFLGTIDDTALTCDWVRGGLVNWDVCVVQGDFDSGGAGPANDIVVWGQHLVAPHAGEPAPNPLIVIGAFQNVVLGAPGVLIFNNSVSHGDHFDNMQLMYAPDVAGVSSFLRVLILHSDTEGDQDTLPFTPPSSPPEESPCEPPADVVLWGEAPYDIPTVSEWGLIVLTLLLLGAGAVIFRRHRRAAA